MRRSFAAIFIAALLCGVLCYGAEPALIDAPAKADQYRLIDAKVSGDWESAIWAIEPEAAADMRVSGDGKSLVFVAPPGTYTIRVVCVNFSAKKLAQAKHVLTIGGVNPLPPVPPNPPLPPPPGQKVQVVVFVETAKMPSMPAAQREMLAGLKFRQAIKDKGHLLLGVYDPDPDKSPSKDYKPWFDAVKGKPLPCVAVRPINGGPIVTANLPPDAEGFWSLLDKGGK